MMSSGLRRDPRLWGCALAHASRLHSSKLAGRHDSRSPPALGQRGWVAALWSCRLVAITAAYVHAGECEKQQGGTECKWRVSGFAFLWTAEADARF